MSIISASTTSTTAYKVTADTTGTLVLQTGATPTTAVTIGTDQNITTTGNVRLSNGAADGAQLILASSGFSDWNIDNFSGRFRWYYNTTEYMTLDASGNLGVGETSPGARIDVKSAATDFTGLILNNTSTSGKKYNIVSAGSGSYFDIPTGAFGIRDLTAGATRMVIDSSGNLLVGTTTQDSGARFTLDSAGAVALSIIGNTTSNAGRIYFKNPNGVVGQISTSGSTTTYSTSSDYRLKENIEPMTGALATVSQLNPVTYNWKADGSEGQGFIAHELQAVVPDAVVGEKDAVDADGNPVYQGIDTSFLVATLTAAIQEQQALITTLTERITALENK